MAETNEQEVRRIVQDELLGILADAKAMLGGKDPTGEARKFKRYPKVQLLAATIPSYNRAVCAG